MKKKEYYTIEEAAKIVGLSWQNLYYRVQSGVLPAEKRQVSVVSIAKKWCVPHDSLMKFKHAYDKLNCE